LAACGQAGVILYTRLRALRCTGALHDVLHRRFTRGYFLLSVTVQNP
jgi:hypothetical protein